MCRQVDVHCWPLHLFIPKLAVTTQPNYLADLLVTHTHMYTHNTKLILSLSLSLSLTHTHTHARTRTTQHNTHRTAPEALTRAKFSTASDVWSYGIVLWEIYSLGKIPWDGLSPIEIRDLLLQGERLTRPNRCPLDMYEVMLDCWEPAPQDRPMFGILVQRVEIVSAGYPQSK